MSATKAIYKLNPDRPSSLMRRALLVLGLSFVLLSVAALPVVAGADGEEERGSSDRGRGRSGEAPGATAEDHDEDGDEERRGPPAPIGSFAVHEETRQADGQQVAFGYSDAGIQRFTYGNTTLFDLTVVARPSGDDARESGVQARGGEMRVRTPTFKFTAHDNPAAVSRVETDGTVSVTFTEGTILVQTDDGRLRFERDGLRGTIRADEPRVVDRTVTAEGDMLLFVDAPRGDFDKNRGHIGEAIARGHVGAEATFNRLDSQVQQEVVSYGNVTMTTLKAEKGNLTVLVDGHGFDGRVLVLNVDGRVLGASQANDLSVLFDNLSISPASNLTDILDPDDDGYAPEYYLVFDPGQEAFQLIVTVPHYSVHTLSVTSAIILPPPSVMVGLVAGIALLVPAGYVLFRRK